MKLRKLLDSKYLNIIVLLLFAAVPPLFYLDYIQNDLLLVSGDGVNSFSLRMLFNDMIFSEGFPYWNKYLEGGMPYGAYDTCGLYPINLILCFLPPAAYCYVWYFIHLVIGAYFFRGYLQEIGCSRLASVITALIYETSIHLNGVRKSHIYIIAAVVWLPVILYFIQKYLNTKELKWLICSAVCMTFQFLGTSLQHAFYTDVLAFIYLLVWAVRNKTGIKKTAAHMAAWFFTYIGTAFAQLYATLLVFAGMADAGTSGNPFENFISYSVHPAKLLQMAFPYIFGDNVYQAFGTGNSSEMDIELFLGFFVLICLIFCSTCLLRKFEVKLSLVFMTVAFAYSAMAHIPFLARVIYMLPVFSGFRVPARALFIFIFFCLVILGIFITELSSERVFKKFLRFGGRFSGAVLTVIFAIGAAMLMTAGSEEQMKDSIISFEKVFMPAAAVCAVLAVLAFAYRTSPFLRKRPRLCSTALSIVILLSTLAETLPFSEMTSPSPGDYFSQEPSGFTAELAGTDSKVIDAFTGIDGAHQSIISQNSSMHKDIPGINAYLAFNNPGLYRMLSGSNSFQLNYSGLMTGFPNMSDILLNKNDLLSVLGVKYIIDSSGILEKNPCYITELDAGEVIYKGADTPAVFPAVAEAGQYNVYSDMMELSSLTAYRIDFDISVQQEPEVLYVDIVTGSIDGYNKEVSVTAGDNHVTAYYTTDITADYSSGIVRVVMENHAEVSISSFTVSSCGSAAGNEPVYSADSMTVDAAEPGGVAVLAEDIGLLPRTDYLISFETRSDSPADLFYMDLYAQGYDDPAQQLDISLSAGEAVRHTFVMDSGDCPEEGVQIRFVSGCPSPVTVSGISVAAADENELYIPYYSGSEGNIYLNPNAKDILFTVDNVRSVPEDEDIYSRIEEYDLLNTAYVQDHGSDRDISGAGTVISDISFKNNSISARVSSGGDTFVNFSQCYYWGWKAYVDGQATPVYIVDDVIMGIDVPAGDHLIEFKYSIPFFPAAVGLSVGVAVFWVIYFAVTDRREKKKKA